MTGIDIKRFREKLGLTQAEFAARIGVSVNTVNRWERGSAEPSRLAVDKIKQIRRGGNET